MVKLSERYSVLESQGNRAAQELEYFLQGKNKEMSEFTAWVEPVLGLFQDLDREYVLNILASRYDPLTGGFILGEVATRNDRNPSPQTITSDALHERLRESQRWHVTWDQQTRAMRVTDRPSSPARRLDTIDLFRALAS